MAAILEAKAIITAEDRTKAAFASIMANMEGVFNKAKALDKLMTSTSRSIGSSGNGIDAVGRGLVTGAEAITRAARALERAANRVGRGGEGGGSGGNGARPSRGGHGWAPAVEHFGTDRGLNHAIRAGGMAVPVIGGVGLAAGGVLVGEGVRFAAEKSAERQHERVRADISGMTPSEREDAESRAAQLAAKYPSISQTSIEHTLRNARSIAGSYSEASSLADDILRTRIVAQAARPGQDVEGDFDKLMKGLEQYGVTQDPAKFKSAMRDIQKVLAVEGDTLTADSIYQTFKFSRQALPAASQRFMLGAAPAIAQEMGGNSFGVALSAFSRAIVTGRMDGQALQTALDLGLVDEKDVEMKKGHAVRLKTSLEGGAGFHNWKEAASDPDKWIYDTLVPALKAKGIVNPDEVMQIASILFSNRMAGDFVDKFLTQRDRIEKNQANLARAPEDPATRIMAGDPIVAYEGVKNAFENLAASIGLSGAHVTGALNGVAAVVNDEAARLQGATTDRMRRAANLEKYGVDSTRDFTKAPVGDLVAAKENALGEDAKRLDALKLELAGVKAENAAIGRMGWGEYTTSGRSALQDAALPFRVIEIEREIAALETARERLRDLGDAYETYKRAAAHDPRGLLINSGGGAAIPGFNHAAFPLGGTFGDVDPATGRPYGVGAGPAGAAPTGEDARAQSRVVSALNPNPYGSLDGVSRGPIEAELKGSIVFGGTIDVKVPAGWEARLTRLEAQSNTPSIKMDLGLSRADTDPRNGRR